MMYQSRDQTPTKYKMMSDILDLIWEVRQKQFKEERLLIERLLIQRRTVGSNPGG